MKKLKLNKQTISILEKVEKKSILGGKNTFIVETSCWVSCHCTIDPTGCVTDSYYLDCSPW